MAKFERSQYDCVILGAGVIGCNIAFELARKGIDVLVIEKQDSIATGATSAAGGIFMYSSCIPRPTQWHELAQQGINFQKRLEKLLSNYSKLNWNWVGRLEIAQKLKDNEVELIYNKFKRESSQNKQVQWLNSNDIIHKLGVSGQYEGYINLEEGWVHPIELSQTLYSASKDHNAQFVFNSMVTSVEFIKGYHIIKFVNGDYISAKNLIIATGIGINNIEFYKADTYIQPHIIPVKGQSIFLQNAKVNVKFKEIICTSGILCVPRENGLFVGSTLEENVQTNGNTLKLTSVLSRSLELFPELENHPITDIHYSFGFRPMTKDLIPIVSKDKQIPNLIWAIGHYDKGIFLSPITAYLVAEMFTI